MSALAASTAVAFVTMSLYWATLLPGQDLGDTASFQTVAATRMVSSRDGYPLYFALGFAFVELGALVGREPAFMLNVASAACGAIACSLLAWLAGRLSGSVGGAVFAALLFGSSYTFWSQAIIAEVYALHVLLMAATLTAFFAWAERPTTGRLAVAFAIYALSFGNHLSMILLAPALMIVLLRRMPGGARGLIRLPVVTLASVLALLSALQYAPLYASLHEAMPPDASGGSETLKTFWFDVTKADWRESMVLAIPASETADRLAMTWFDARQQFGLVGVGLCVTGAIWLLLTRTAIAGALLVIWTTTVAFAFTYNVGDAHVFYIPGHAMVALLGAGCGGLLATTLHRPWLRRLAMALLVMYPGWRMLDTFPAIDRSDDRRARQMLERLSEGLGGTGSVLAADLNWQLQNGLSYYLASTRPDITFFRATDVLLYLPYFLRSNLEVGREVVATEPSARLALGAYGPLIAATPDNRVPAPQLSDTVAGVPRGAPYVLCLLRQSQEFPIDRDDVQRAARALSGVSLHAARYNVLAGLAGRPPSFVAATDRPFRRDLAVGDLRLDIRMESWLATDTIRRAGFGHVVANRHHALTIERGVSFVAFDAVGRVITTAYHGGLYGPHARYRLTLTAQSR